MRMTKRYAVVLEQDEEGWIVAEVPALPGCATQGRTREEALANIREAMTGYLETLVEQGAPIPDDNVEMVEVAVA